VPDFEKIRKTVLPARPFVTKDSNLVFSFPVSSPDGAVCTKEMGAMEQLRLWKVYQDHWCEHKPSITVYYRDEEFLDVIDGIEHLSDKGYIDKAKVGIGGGSYGGYFSALGATRYSEHFAAAIPFVGVTNQLSKVNLTDIPYEIYQVHWTIWPNDNPELYYDRSPVKYSANNRTPTLILHGKEDTRVHPSQSLELYRQLKLHGQAPVRLVWYPGEGHGNKNTQSQLDFNLRTMRWFNHYLKGEGNPKELPPLEVNYELEKLGETSLDAKPKP